MYRSSLFVHAQFGETFKSLFDTHRNKASVEDIIDEIVSITEDATLKIKSSKEKYKEAWRYAQYSKIWADDRAISPYELSVRRSSDMAIKAKASQS